MVGTVPVGGDAPDLDPVDDDDEDRRRRRHARADLRARRRRLRHRALHVQRGGSGRRARADRAAVAGADRRRHPLPAQARARARWKPACRRCASTRATSARPSTSSSSRSEAKDRGLPIRIGVNAGSLDPAMAEQHGGITPEALVASAMHELDLFREVGFDDVKISVKASSVPLMIDAYRLLADTTDHPLHLGVTEAGPPPAGLVKSVAGIGDAARRGHRRHDPLLAHRRSGRGGEGRPHAARGARPARTQGPRPHRVPVVRARRGRRHPRRVRRAGRARGTQHPAPGRGDGLRRQRSR